MKTNKTEKKIEEYRFDLEFKAKLDKAIKGERKIQVKFFKAYIDL